MAVHRANMKCVIGVVDLKVLFICIFTTEDSVFRDPWSAAVSSCVSTDQLICTNFHQSWFVELVLYLAVLSLPSDTPILFACHFLWNLKRCQAQIPCDTHGGPLMFVGFFWRGHPEQRPDGFVSMSSGMGHACPDNDQLLCGNVGEKLNSATSSIYP